MALHKDFPDSPHAILDPSIRWFPADEAAVCASDPELGALMARFAESRRADS